MRATTFALAIAFGGSVALSADPPTLIFRDAVVVDFFADYGNSRYGLAASGDLNGDGITDFVVAGQYDEIRYLAGTPEGGFAASLVTLSTKYRGGSSGHVLLEAVDADGDGDDDVVFDSALQGAVILRNDGGGTFTEFAANPGTEAYYGARVLFDLGGDGDLDVMAPVYTPPGANNPGFRVYENLGDSFVTGPHFPFPVSGVAKRCDLDDDGRDDVAIVHASTVTVLRQTPEGTLVAGTPIAHSAIAFSALVLDAEGDGDQDVLAHGRLLRNDGTGALTEDAATYTTATFGFPEVVDFDRDGLEDVIDKLTGQPIRFFRNTGAGLAAPVTLDPGITVGNTTRIAVEDVDGDGKPDLLTQDSGDNKLSILRQAGFPAPVALVVAPGAIVVPGESTVALAGNGFRDGATVDLGPGIEATSVVVASPTEASATLDVQPGIGGGERIVRFTNDDGQAVLSSVEVHSLDARALAGKLLDSPAPARDVLRLRGALPRNGLSANDAFAGREEGLRLDVGSGLTRYSLEIPAGDPRWREARRGRRLAFRTLPDEFPRVRLTVDLAKESFDLAVSFFDYPEAPADASLGVFSGDDLGRDDAAWESDRSGRRYRLR